MDDFLPEPPRIQIPATFCFYDQSLPIQVLFDSGAKANFLDTEVAQ